MDSTLGLRTNDAPDVRLENRLQEFPLCHDGLLHDTARPHNRSRGVKRQTPRDGRGGNDSFNGLFQHLFTTNSPVHTDPIYLTMNYHKSGMLKLP
jgi:hypothetical protein